MSPDNELRELRDTLAIEITREMVRRQMETDTARDGAIEGLTFVYAMADAVLSGREAKAAPLPGERRDFRKPQVFAHCPTCLSGNTDPLCAHMAETIEHPVPMHIWATKKEFEAYFDNPGWSAKAEADESFVRANFPGICRTYANGPHCSPGCLQVSMGGIEIGGNIHYDACTPPLPPAEAWAEARRMTEERMKAAGQ